MHKLSDYTKDPFFLTLQDILDHFTEFNISPKHVFIKAKNVPVPRKYVQHYTAHSLCLSLDEWSAHLQVSKGVLYSRLRNMLEEDTYDDIFVPGRKPRKSL